TAARKAEHPMSREVGYRITDTWDELVDTIQEIAPTTLEGGQSESDRACYYYRRFHRHTAMLLESEARHTREAWSHSMNCSKAVHAELQAYQAQVNTHKIQIQTRDTRIGSLEALVATLVAQTLSL
ncbi:hypothetical protein Tco_0177773, partial [Tanacetum coccineum]